MMGGGVVGEDELCAGDGGGGGTKVKISEYPPPCSCTLSHELPLLIPVSRK